MKTGPDFRLWEVGRVVFRVQDGITITCPACSQVGASISYLPGHVVHVAGWEPVPGRPNLSRLTVIESCPAGVKKALLAIDKTVEKKLVGARLVAHDMQDKLDAKFITLDFENDHGEPLRLTFVLEKGTKVTTYVRKVPPLPTKERGPSHNHK